MNLFSHVKNGQFFCLEQEPSTIGIRICDRIKLFTEFNEFGYAKQQIVVQVKWLSNNKIKDISAFNARKLVVIPLGKR